MAEGFDGCHIPQRSRRVKLRNLTAQNQPSSLEPSLNGHPGAGLLPLYDPPSLTSSDLQTCAGAGIQDFPHRRTSLLPGASQSCKENAGCSVKVSVNTMGLVCNLMNPPSTSNFRMDQPQQHYFDLQSSLSLNPDPIQHIDTNTLFHSPHTLHTGRDFDHVGKNDGEVVVFKPEPLSLSLPSRPSYQNSQQLELNLQSYDCAVYPSPIIGSISNDISRSSAPLGPFTGYASILKGSRFFRPAQQLLEEFCAIWGQGNFSDDLEIDSGLMDSPSEALSGIVDNPLSSGNYGGESREKKSRLISMIDEICRRYKQYYQQLQEVVGSFEYVSGLSKAAPYANLAMKAMSKHFRRLKNALSDQLRVTNKAQSNFSRKYIQNSGFLGQQPAWRPQRGLPEQAVTVLRAWLFEHFLHPYPTDTDKLTLAKQTGLSRSQVFNWFINARVRLWKPMVEDIHMLETRLGQTTEQAEERNVDTSNDQFPSANSLADNPSRSTLPVQDYSSKRTRNDLPSYNNLSSHGPQTDVSAAIVRGGGGFRGGVSLTLGLHQNNGVDPSEPFQITAFQRFGLGLEDSINRGRSVIGGSEAQSRHFGRDVIGGQLFHDFVG